MAPSENLLFFSHIATSHWLLCLLSLSAFFLGKAVIQNLQSEPGRPPQSPVLAAGETEAQGLLSGAFAQAQDAWQLGGGLGPWVLPFGFCPGLSGATSQVRGLRGPFSSRAPGVRCVKAGASSPAPGLL